jgi:hypothetical protein
MNEPHFQGWNTNNKKTSISTLKVKYPKIKDLKVQDKESA